MRRSISVMLVMIICVLFSSCDTSKTNKICQHNWERVENINEYTAVDQCSICTVTRRYIDSDKITYSGDEAGVKMLRYDWDGYGISLKEINNCDLGYAIIDCLSKLQETDQIIPSISDDVVNEFAGQLPVKEGTLWIECGSAGLFRVNPALTEICKVQTHLGEGKVLQLTDALKELIRGAWYHHPNDYWFGIYEDGGVSLQQLYKADSAVEWVTIESINIENKIDSDNNKITLCVRANETKTVNAYIESYQSDDNRGSDDKKEIELVKGDETTVEFTFYGFYNYSYRMTILIDNTKIDLTINPKSSN